MWLNEVVAELRGRLYGLSFRKRDSVTRKREMSKQAMRDETERLVKEALERKTLTVKQGRDSYREQMPKVRRAKSRLSRSRTGSSAVHV